MTTTAVFTGTKIKNAELTPLPAGRAAAHFLIAGLSVRIGLYQGIPALIDLGLQPFQAFAVSMIVPMAVLFALALGFARQEGVPVSFSAMAARFRMRRLRPGDFLRVLIVFAASAAASTLLGPTRTWILQILPALQPPADFPVILNPLTQNEALVSLATAWMGAEVSGNWGYGLLAAMLFFFNIMGEELYWRGLLFPRQQLVHGRRTWIVHGLMWNLFHLPFYPWYLVFGLPISLAVSYVAQKSGTWAAILMHSLANLFMYLLIFALIAGAV